LPGNSIDTYGKYGSVDAGGVYIGQLPAFFAWYWSLIDHTPVVDVLEVGAAVGEILLPM
jgi:hypothetical protein